MKIGVLFNCQHAGIRNSLQALRPRDKVVSFGLPPRDTSPAVRARADAVLGGCDVIVASPATTRNGFAAPWQAQGARIVNVPSVAFTGYHPDTILVATRGGTLSGPTGLLHSRIGLAGFLGGLDVADTADLFNRMMFNRLGYIEQFAVQRTLLHERFSRHGIDIAPEVARWHAQGAFMHNLNHPRAVALFGLGRVACGLLDLPAEPGAVMPPDTLAKHAGHPVHPELAAAFGVKAEPGFKPMAHAGHEMLDLETYLAASFALYAAVARGDLLAADGVAAAMRTMGLDGAEDVPQAQGAPAQAAEDLLDADID